MTLLLALVLALGATEAGRFDRFCRQRDSRGFDCNNSAHFDFAPVGGNGVGNACACTAVTGTKGETIFATRATAGACTKEGLGVSGIAPGDVVSCGANLPRIEPDGSGVNGILVEPATTNDCLRSEALNNAVWTATATVTSNVYTAPDNTLNADRLNDGSGVALQGVSQAITTAVASKHTFSCYVMADTATSATVTMTGTGSSTGDCTASVTGLSAASYRRLSCTSPAAYAGTLTAVTVALAVGDNAAVTGQIAAWGCMHETNAWASSYITTVGSSATRGSENVTVDGTNFPSAPFSVSAFVTTQWSQADIIPAGIFEGQIGSNTGAGLFFAAGFLRFQTLNFGSALLQWAPPGGTVVAGVANKAAASNSGGNSSSYWNSVLVAGPTATNNTTSPWSVGTGIGYAPAGPWQLNGIISRVCLDGTAGGCPP